MAARAPVSLARQLAALAAAGRNGLSACSTVREQPSCTLRRSATAQPAPADLCLHAVLALSIAVSDMRAGLQCGAPSTSGRSAPALATQLTRGSHAASLAAHVGSARATQHVSRWRDIEAAALRRTVPRAVAAPVASPSDLLVRTPWTPIRCSTACHRHAVPRARALMLWQHHIYELVRAARPAAPLPASANRRGSAQCQLLAQWAQPAPRVQPRTRPPCECLQSKRLLGRACVRTRRCR